MMLPSFTWKTAAVIRETAGAVTIVFDTGSDDFHYLPGQYINMRVVVDGQSLYRSYSLSSSPGMDDRPSVTIKAIEGGIVSRYIVQHAEEIREWTVEGPLGSFCLSPDARVDGDFIFVAAGSGITPVYSMIKYLLRNSEVRIMLVYSNRDPESTIFRHALQYMEQQFSARFKIVHVLTKAARETKVDEEIYYGRLSSLLLRKIIRKHMNAASTRATTYICGPEGFIDMSVKAMEQLGMDQQRVLTERFTVQQDTGMPNLSVQEVLFHFENQTHLLTVDPGISILEAALVDKVPVSYSCKAGSCGRCVAKLEAGEVHMPVNHALDPNMLAQKYILICQSYPLNSEVEVSIA